MQFLCGQQGKKNHTRKKKERNVSILLALKYAQNFECMCRTFHKLKIYALKRQRDGSSCSFHFPILFVYSGTDVFFPFIFSSCLCMYKLTVIKDQAQRTGMGRGERELFYNESSRVLF